MTEQIDPLDGQEFYELMQRYRHSGIQVGKRPQGKETDVVEAFEAVKEWVRTQYGVMLVEGEDHAKGA